LAPAAEFLERAEHENIGSKLATIETNSCHWIQTHVRARLSYDGECGERVQVDDGGEYDGQQLAHRHDDDEDDRAELRDGVVDEQLPAGRAQRQHHAVAHEPQHFSYLCTYDLYGPVYTAFDTGSIHYGGKWEGVGPWKARLFWALRNNIERER
jgi:hypothetical protein